MVLLTKNYLSEYQKIKEEIENRAEEIIKDYYDYKNWDFPNDFSIENVNIDEDEVCISYFAFDTNEDEVLPIHYFITKNREYLK